MGPLAALLARLAPSAAGLARGASKSPMGSAIPASMFGRLGTPQRITPADIVQPDGEASDATEAIRSLTKATAGAAAALLVLPKATHAVSNRFLEAQRSLTQYNATIAAAFHKLEVGRIQREIGRGASTAGTTRELADSTNRLETALQPFGNLATNFKNTFADAINEAAVFVLNGIAPAFDKLNGLLFEQQTPQPEQLQQFLDLRRNEWLDEQKKRREPALNLDRPNGN